MLVEGKTIGIHARIKNTLSESAAFRQLSLLVVGELAFGRSHAWSTLRSLSVTGQRALEGIKRDTAGLRRAR